MTTYVVVDDSDFRLTSEWVDGFWVLHCDVFTRWSKTTLTRLRGLLKRVAEVSEYPVYAFQTPSHDPLKRKFIQQVGGILEHERLTPDGEIAEMFRFLP